MANCTALDAANFISNFISNAGVFTGLPQHYQNALGDASFYCNLRQYVIEDQLQGVYQNGAAKQLAKVIGVMSSVFITIWVMMQGFKIISGTMRTPILELGFHAAKMILVLTLISLTLANTPWITEQVTMFQESIAVFVTGTSTPIDDLIDFNVAATALIDLVVQDITGKGGGTPSTIGSNSLMAGWLGQGGPAVTAASLLMMARVAIVFGIMLAPLFLFFILFEKTNGLFWQWVKYLLSIFFAMAALSVVTVIALQAMSQYGFRVFLSMLVNQMDPGAFRAILVSVITENLSGPTASVDVGGGLTRLAMMGAFFTALILAVPAIVMTFFGAAMNLAAQGLSHMTNPNSAASGQAAQSNVSNNLQTTQDQRFNTSQSANHYGNESGLPAGAATMNHQTMQQIGAMQAQQSRGAVGEAGMVGQRQSVGLANSSKFQPEGLSSAQIRNASQSAALETAPRSPAVGGPVQLNSPQPVASSAGSNGGYVSVNTAAALPPLGPATGSQGEATVQIGASPTPVYAVPPPGLSSQRQQDAIEVPARDVTVRPGPVRPGAQSLVQRPSR